MRRASDWPVGWVDATKRIGHLPHARAIAAGLLGALAVAESSADAVNAGLSPQIALVLALVALATTLPVGFASPTGAALSVSAACLLSGTLFHSLTAAGAIAELLVIYRLGRRGPHLPALGLAGLFLLVALVGSASPGLGVRELLLGALAPAAALAGIARRAQTEAAAQSAATRVAASSQLEHSARGERARISRELHDVVAHHVSMIAVQAETARLATPGMPAAGSERLAAIGDTARAALTEMRRLLGVLREDAWVEEPGRWPQPGLGQLNELVDAARDASGVGARLILRGTPVALDPGVELAAYRIAQEALTNARRHAPGAAVDVSLAYAPDALLLRIRDNGPGPRPAEPPGGHGLLGMRERAAAVGGRLSTGAALGGGFVVDARLPVRAEDVR